MVLLSSPLSRIAFICSNRPVVRWSAVTNGDCRRVHRTTSRSDREQSRRKCARRIPRIPLHVEEVSVSRREIENAKVQIALVTGTQEQLIDEELTRVRVEIELVPIGRTIQVVPPISQEGDTTIIPVVEEIVVVERRLVLKEEVRIRRVRTKEQHQETVVLREQ